MHTEPCHTLIALARLLSSLNSERLICQEVIHTLTRLLGARCGALVLTDADDTIVHFVHSGAHPETGKPFERHLQCQGLLARAAPGGASLRIDDLARDPCAAAFRTHLPDATALLAIPLPQREEVGGFAYLCDRLDGPAFTVADQRLAEDLAVILALVLENARNHAEVSDAQTRLARSEARYRHLYDRAMRRERILHALSEAAQDFLKHGLAPNHVRSALAGLGMAAEVSRVYIFENTQDAEGQWVSTQRHEWSAEGITPQIDNPLASPRWEPELTAMRDRLVRGEIVQGLIGSFPPSEQAILTAQEIRSLAIVPVFVAGRWWGLIGFDECRYDRHWEPPELDTLRAVADVLGAAIERGQTEEQLRVAASVFENDLVGILITNPRGDILRVNNAFLSTTGYSPDEVLGRNPRLLQSGRQDLDFYQGMWQDLVRLGHWQGEVWNRRKNGDLFPEWLTITTVRGQDGAVTHYVGIFNDISEKKAAEERIRRLAHYDALTGLVNRSLFIDRLNQALLHARREHRWLALLYLDLDRFKPVNDSLGHAAGDRLLREAARLLSECLRDCDTVARLGGDEFTLLLTDLPDEEQARTAARQVAEKIAAAFSPPITLDEQEVTVGASIGISLYPRDGVRGSDLLGHADAAMYHVKRSGRGHHAFYSRSMGARTRERLALESRLRRALDKGDFLLYYQPWVNSDSGRMEGVEALIRWPMAPGQLLLPGEFIPLAEETGLILPLGVWVLRTACRQLAAWRSSHPDLHVAVNISPEQFRHRHFLPEVAGTLLASGVDPRRLHFEITEGSLLADEAITQLTLKSLAEHGVAVAIDDFGVGYSSLSYLKRFPIRSIKVDRSFVQDIPHDPNSNAITSAILAMARSLRLEVIAEGVEYPEQFEFLRRGGCHLVQGYCYSPPLPVAGIEGLLATGGPITPRCLRQGGQAAG